MSQAGVNIRYPMCPSEQPDDCGNPSVGIINLRLLGLLCFSSLQKSAGHVMQDLWTRLMTLQSQPFTFRKTMRTVPSVLSSTTSTGDSLLTGEDYWDTCILCVYPECRGDCLSNSRGSLAARRLVAYCCLGCCFGTR